MSLEASCTVQYTHGVFPVNYDPTIEDTYRANYVITLDENQETKSIAVDILDTAGTVMNG